MRLKTTILAVGAAALFGLGIAPALAHDHWHDHGWHDHHGWHDGDYYRPGVTFDIDLWHHGYWDHRWYDGRYGWWWVVGPDEYYYYDQPAYPYPDPYGPRTVIIQQPPAPPPVMGVAPQQNWYYCDDPKGYYPYVQSCRSQWRPVPVTPEGK